MTNEQRAASSNDQIRCTGLFAMCSSTCERMVKKWPAAACSPVTPAAAAHSCQCVSLRRISASSCALSSTVPLPISTGCRRCWASSRRSSSAWSRPCTRQAWDRITRCPYALPSLQVHTAVPVAGPCAQPLASQEARRLVLCTCQLPRGAPVNKQSRMRACADKSAHLHSTCPKLFLNFSLTRPPTSP